MPFTKHDFSLISFSRTSIRLLTCNCLVLRFSLKCECASISGLSMVVFSVLWFSLGYFLIQWFSKHSSSCFPQYSILSLFSCYIFYNHSCCNRLHSFPPPKWLALSFTLLLLLMKSSLCLFIFYALWLSFLFFNNWRQSHRS